MRISSLRNNVGVNIQVVDVLGRKVKERITTASAEGKLKYEKVHTTRGVMVSRTKDGSDIHS